MDDGLPPLDPFQAFRLNDRVAVVTGASSGLGARFGRVLAAAGARVVLGARRMDRLRSVADVIVGAGGEAVAVGCDVTREADADALIAAAVERFGTVDILVNNAGVVSRETGEESLESFRRVVEVNLVGAYLCIRAASRVMLAKGRGAIVNTASISGLVGMMGGDLPSYTASKAAVVNMTRDLGALWAARGVRVNALAPGWFPSEMTAAELADPKRVEEISAQTPIGRPGREDELDGALLFLTSDASSYVTGHTLVVDGGWTAT